MVAELETATATLSTRPAPTDRLVGYALGADGLVTDRPDFTESGLVVGRTVLQLEAGGTYVEADDEGEVRDVESPRHVTAHTGNT